MSIPTHVLFCAALGLAACSSSSPNSATASSGAPPSSDTLCKLRIGQSTPTDAEGLLGTPTFRADSADGSLALEYQYLALPSIADLRLQFGAQKVFSGATTVNIPEPPCWNVDGGR